MAKKLDPRLLDILTTYGENPEDALWDCHGTWVAYHKAIERIAAKANITFDMPQVIEANSAGKVVAIAVRGTMGERSEWSFGEASPGNNKNSYPYAMAEKRAKDRVVIKLVGLSGIYSEEEADDFKPRSAPAQEAPEKRVVGFRTDGTRTPHSLRKERVWEEQFIRELDECTTVNAVNKFALAWSLKIEADKWPEEWRELAREEIRKHKLLVANNAPDDDTFPGDIPNGRGQIISTLQAG